MSGPYRDSEIRLFDVSKGRTALVKEEEIMAKDKKLVEAITSMEVDFRSEERRVGKECRL